MALTNYFNKIFKPKTSISTQESLLIGKSRKELDEITTPSTNLARQFVGSLPEAAYKTALNILKPAQQMSEQADRQFTNMQRAFLPSNMGLQNVKPIPLTETSSQKLNRLQAEERHALSETDRSFFSRFSESIGRQLGITPTFERLQAIAAPYVVPKEELAGIVEPLVGLKPGGIKEAAIIAMDLPLPSLGVSEYLSKVAVRNLPKVVGPKVAATLSRELVEFLPTVLKNLATKPVQDLLPNEIGVIQDSFKQALIKSGVPKDQAEKLATQGGFFGDFFKSPKAQELGETINKLNKQYVEKPTSANKKVLELAKEAYRREMQGGFVRLKAEPEDPLLQEARKYKTAEEFVKAQIDEPIGKQAFNIRQKLYDETGYRADKTTTLYHGTDATTAEQIRKSGTIGTSPDSITFFTKSAKEAKEYAQNKAKYRGKQPEVIKVEIPTQVIRKGQQSGAGGFEYEVDGILDYNPEYGIAKHSNENLVKTFGDEESKNIKTKSQLTDIWNKANVVSPGTRPLTTTPALEQQQLTKGLQNLEREIQQPQTIPKPTTPAITPQLDKTKNIVSYEDSIVKPITSRQEAQTAKQAFNIGEEFGISGRELRDLEIESMQFSDTELEHNYQLFKQRYSKFRVNNPEDATQFKVKVPESKDWFYSQEMGDEELFIRFVDRYELEKSIKSKPIRSLDKIVDILPKKQKDDYYEFIKSRKLIGQRDIQKLNKDFFDSVGIKIHKPKIYTDLVDNVSNYKDISGFKGQARDVYRNFKAFFGEKFNIAKEKILDPFDAAKGRMIDEQKALTDELNETIVKKLGIKKGSKESAAVQEFGEKTKSLADLEKQFGKEKAAKIVEADKWFRAKYDSLLEQVNAVRQQIYPNNSEKIIPKREDYYRHFKELSEGFEGLKNVFETPSGISPQLAGISPFTKPKSKWASFMQRRLGLETDVDAVGGFLNYVPSATYAKHIDPQIGNFRQLAKELADSTETTKNANNFIEFLTDYANDLAGKTNAADRFIQKVIPGGRTTFRAIDWFNKRAKANIILGNLSSSLAQAFNIPQGIASAKEYGVPGAVRTFGSIFAKNAPIADSAFIKERYSRTLFDQFDRGILANTKKFASWVTGVLDEVGTKYIWNSHYEKALGQGIKNPIKYADDITRSLVAGRGVGEVPLIQKSKLFQLIAPFQLEVGNLWYVMGDMVKTKDFAGLATLAVSSFLMNRVAEKIKGSDVSFDPVNAVYEGVQMLQNEPNKGRGAIKFGGRVGGEVLSNIPLGQTLASLYPEYGFDIPGVGKMTRRELFGSGDPTRFGTTIGALPGALKDPLFKVIPPFGGVQLKKTIEGTRSFLQGGISDKSGQQQFTTPDSLITGAQMAAFGKYAPQEARNYFKRSETPEALQIKELKRQATKQTDKLNQNAQKTYQNIKDLPQDRLKEALSALGRTDEKLADKVLDMYLEEKLGFTYLDKQIKSLGVENGQRAKFLSNMIKGMPKEQKKDKVLNLVKKKILTEKVLDQILELQTNP